MELALETTGVGKRHGQNGGLRAQRTGCGSRYPGPVMIATG